MGVRELKGGGGGGSRWGRPEKLPKVPPLGTTAVTGPRHICLSFQDSTSRPQSHRHWLALGFSFALTAVTLFFVFRGIDRQAFARLLATQDRGWLAVAAGVLFAPNFFRAPRLAPLPSALICAPRPPA